MRIAALQKTSFVDFPGKIAAVVFTQGCNFKCFYCHNGGLINCEACAQAIRPSQVIKYLHERRGLVDAVVLSGGEPTLQPGLAHFIAKLKAMDYEVKLDTNGTRPAILASLINGGLLDYVAMDIKAPTDKYESVCGVAVDLGTVNASADLLLSGHVDYEFRTTVVPQFDQTDILAISELIRGARSYVLQQCRRPDSIVPFSDSIPDKTLRPASWIPGLLEELGSKVDHCGTRGFTYSQTLRQRRNLPPRSAAICVGHGFLRTDGVDRNVNRNANRE